ncbi:MAG: tRNA (guanosine(37)-N1)-methyltransferase TrmD [Treponema sp.]|jgi:tRNA (guanine37-N1)-methyltransferase|nr:tRNA (guanosine(37)-N1)-methyltransferase TrmD [Treponema sp.]
MKFTVLTLFPEISDVYFATSIMARALKRGILEYRSVNIRNFALDKHRTCDDAPYGGGPGMLMLAEPLSRALESVGVVSRRAGRQGNPPAEHGAPAECNVQPESGGPAEQGIPAGSPASSGRRPWVVYLSPSGRLFTQQRARELTAEQELVLLCGRYEGIDQRIIDAYVDEELSLGDYVLSSGEVAALAVIDAVYRLVDQVITPESLEEESFSGGLLEHPQYTRPELFDTMEVPGVLLSGHHENIRRWRLQKRVEKTLAFRPDLMERGLKEGIFDAETVKLIKEGNDERDTGNRSFPDESGTGYL